MFEHLTWLLPALKESYKSREDFKEIWRKAFGKKNIVFTGLGGAGKTVLFDFLILLCQIKKCLHLMMSFCRTRCR